MYDNLPIGYPRYSLASADSSISEKYCALKNARYCKYIKGQVPFEIFEKIT